MKQIDLVVPDFFFKFIRAALTRVYRLSVFALYGVYDDIFIERIQGFYRFNSDNSKVKLILLKRKTEKGNKKTEAFTSVFKKSGGR